MSILHNKNQKKRKLNILDSTANDFEDEHFTFRLPKKGRVENCPNDVKAKVKSRRLGSVLKSQTVSSKSKSIKVSQESSSQLTKNNLEELISDNEPNLHDSDTVSQNTEEEPENLSELEKSVCSESEKLCPSCKHIVLVEEFSNHFSKCVQRYKFEKTAKKDNDKIKLLQILPCPICLKSFTSEMERRSHIKICSLKHGLTAEHLISATRLQEKQEEERLALGLPSPRISLVESGLKQRKPAIRSGVGGKKESNPDLELAFALSRSLAEEERRKREKEEDELLSLGLHDVIQEKRRKLVLPQPPLIPLSGKGSRSGKGKKKMMLQTVLMTRTKEERESIITEKVAALLVDEMIHSSLTKRKSNGPRSKKGPLKQYEDENLPLWNFAGKGLEMALNTHYVAELEEFIKPKNIAVGELLKSLSLIPGRLDYTALAEESDDEEDKGNDADMIETTIVDHYCTQLALAEMLCTEDLNELSLDMNPDDANGDEDVDQHEGFAEMKGPEDLRGDVEMRKKFDLRSVVKETCKDEKEIPVVDLTSEDNASLSSQGDTQVNINEVNINDNADNILVYRDTSVNDHEISDEKREMAEKQHHCLDMDANDKDERDSELHFDEENPVDKDPLSSKSNINVSVSEGKLYDRDSCIPLSPLHESEKHELESNEGNISKSSNMSFQYRVNDDETMIEKVTSDKELSNLQDTLYTTKYNPDSDKKELHLSSSPKRLVPSLAKYALPSNASPCYTKLIHDWSCLLSSGDKSDVTIITADGEIPVHSLVLAVRCPQILNEIQDNNNLEEEEDNCSYLSPDGKLKYINWNEIGYESAYSFMVYLYSSVCSLQSKKENLWMDLYDLSLKFKCTELIEHLKLISEKSSEQSVETELYQHSEHSFNQFDGMSTPGVVKTLDKASDNFKELSGNNSLSPNEPSSKSVKYANLCKENNISCSLKENVVNSNECMPIVFDKNSSLEPSEEIICLEVENQLSAKKSKYKKLNHLYNSTASPDIFGEWDDINSSKDLMENPSVTPPGANIEASLLENLHSPKLILDNAFQDNFNNYTKKSDLIITSMDGDLGSSKSANGTKLSLRRNLSQVFRKSRSLQSEKSHNDSSSDLGNENLCNKSFDSLPDFHNSSLSNLEYPSANEFVDLTISSENSLDATKEEKNPNEAKKTKKSHSPSSSNSVPLSNELKFEENEDDIYSYFKQKFDFKSPSKQTKSVLCIEFQSPATDCNTPIGEIIDPLNFGKLNNKISPNGNKHFSSNMPNITTLIDSPILDSHSKQQLSGEKRIKIRSVNFDHTSEKRSRQTNSHDHFHPIDNDECNNSQTSKKSVHSRLSIKSMSETQLSEGTFNGLSDESLLKVVGDYEEQFKSKKLETTSKACVNKTNFLKSKSCTSISLNSFITPDKQNINKPIARLQKSFNVSPMPDYNSMVTPELNKQLDKYGIRKLSRKKAVKLLLHIYEQLHPLVTDTEAETPLTKSVAPPPIEFTRKRKGQEKALEATASSEDILNSSQNSSTSVESGFECLEETAFPDPQDEDDASNTSQQSSLETRLATFIRSDIELHTKILRYEPVWANELLQDLKFNGIKCSMAKLINFLDEQCITFRLPAKERTRTRKRARKGSSNKSPRKRVPNIR